MTPMRQDPERFVTFVLGAFMFSYYIGVGLQARRVWKLIGRCPILRSGTGWGLGPAGAFLWPLPVLAWAHCPRCFRGVAHWAFLENWPMRLLGLFFLCVSAALCATAYAELGARWRIGIDPEPPEDFVRGGVYGSLRHPVYAAFWLALLGVFLLAPNLLFAALWAGGSTVIALQAQKEEQYLAARFGKRYRDYMLGTGRFFPLWR